MRIVLDTGVPETALNVMAAEISEPAAFDAFVTQVLAAGSALWPGQVIALTPGAAAQEDAADDGSANEAADDGAADAGAAAPALNRPRAGTKLAAVVEAILAGRGPQAIADATGMSVKRILAMAFYARKNRYLPARESQA